MRRALLALPVTSLVAAAVLTACTSSANAPSGAPASTLYSTTTQTRSGAPSSTQPGTGDPTPIATGPTTAATAGACPLLATQTAFDSGGMRLGRITTLKAGGRLVGCRFYGLQQPNAQCDASCLKAERLPPGNQPVIEIATSRYRNAVDAHNAIVLIARKGTQPQQVRISGTNTGVCYQTDFYPADKGTDWACTFSAGTAAVVVRTTASSASAAAITRAVARRF